MTNLSNAKQHILLQRAKMGIVSLLCLGTGQQPHLSEYDPISTGIHMQAVARPFQRLQKKIV
jgi:hypothetical protein